MELSEVDLMEDSWAVDVPHEAFTTLRREAPVFWHELEGEKAPGFWAVTKHADVRAVSRDVATYSSEERGTFIADPTPEGLAGWWTTETEGDRTPGGRIAFRFVADGVERGRFDMRILELRADSRVSWEVTAGPGEWIGTRIGFDLREEGPFTIVLFRHEGWKQPVEFMHHCSTKWAVFLLSLKSLVETGKGAPDPNDVKIDDWN